MKTTVVIVEGSSVNTVSKNLMEVLKKYNDCAIMSSNTVPFVNKYDRPHYVNTTVISYSDLNKDWFKDADSLKNLLDLDLRNSLTDDELQELLTHFVEHYELSDLEKEALEFITDKSNNLVPSSKYFNEIVNIRKMVKDH